jgi:hypothetical protein
MAIFLALPDAINNSPLLVEYSMEEGNVKSPRLPVKEQELKVISSKQAIHLFIKLFI